MLIIIFSSFSGFAADGDIVHTGLKKIYRVGTNEVTEDLIDDILNGVDQDKFYKELNGKYINVKDEEDAHMDYLRDLMVKKGLKTPEALEKYLMENAQAVRDKLEKASKNIAKSFEDIRLSPNDKIEDFYNSSSVLKLTSANFSTPEPGNQVGTTKISTLNLPKNSFKWKINISNEKISDIRKGDLVNNPVDYIAHRDIAIKSGEFLNLYAVDRQDKIIAFTSIEIVENMIKKATIYAKELEEGTHYIGPIPGENVNTTTFSDLKFQDIEADEWNVFVSDSSISKPELNSIAPGDKYSSGSDIVANVGDRILLTATTDNKIKAYALIYIGQDHIKTQEDEDDEGKPVLLQAGTHFSPLVKGSLVGSTKFPWLNPRDLGGDIVWRYVVSNKIIPIPELDSTIEDEALDVKILAEDREIEIATEEEILSTGAIHKNLMLIATLDNGEDYKIKGYALLKADNNNIQMPNAKKLEISTHYSTPIKGSGEYTTKIVTLNNTDIDEFNQWRYRLVDKDIENIEFDSVFSNSSFYREGMDIPSAKDGHYLILGATDGYSRLKMYTSIKLEKGMIRDKNADYLISPANYNFNDPSPGKKEGSTKFNTLSFSTNIKDAHKWMIHSSDISFGAIEIDSIVEGAIDYEIGDDIEDIGINDYILLLATDNQGKIKGFTEFRLMEKNIKGGKAVILTEGSKAGENYIIDRGNAPSTTRFKDLKLDGVFGATDWKYKWMEKKLNNDELPYLNQIIDDSEYYYIYNNKGEDIAVSWVSTEDNYGYILLLAVDNYGKTKGYVQISVDSTVVKEHAPTLSDDIELIKGATTDKTNFSNLDDETSYMYILDNFEYTTPALDDVLYNGKIYEGDITVRIGQHLTLFEVDSDKRIKGFKKFVVKSGDIAQGSASFSLIDDNGENWVPEGSIVNGGTGIQIILKDAEWANGIDEKPIRDELFSGFKADKDINQWFNVITRLISDGGGISISDDKLTLSLYLPNTPGYDISDDQEIRFIIPPKAIKGAINPIEASGSIIIKPTIEAIVSGDVVSGVIREKDIKNGGANIVITLLDGDFVGAIDNIALIDAFEGGDNWKIIKEEYKANGSFTRNSSKKVTLTLPAIPEDLANPIDLGSSREDISVIIPKKLIQGSTVDVAATPIFSIYPDVLKIEGKSIADTVTMQAPDGKEILTDHNIWKIKLENSSFVEKLKKEDIVISNLPRGLSYTVKRINDDNIEIILSGRATRPIANEINVILKIKGSAVEETNSQDSEDIILKIKVNKAEDFEGVGYEIRDEKIYLIVPDYMVNVVEYSTDSTNGINGEWDKISTESQLVWESLTPVKVWLREILQPNVFTKAIDLDYEPMPVDISIKGINYEESVNKENILKKVELEGVDNTMEYSLDGGNSWPESSSNLLDLITLSEDSDLRIRVAALTKDYDNLPSLPTKRLNGLFLGNVSLEVGNGKINHTNTSMEYSLDSTNGIDGHWKRASAGETMIKFVKNNRVWIREGKSNLNFRELGEVAEKSKPILFDTNGEPLINEDGDPLIEYNILHTSIKNNTKEIFEYRINGGNWHILDSNILYDDVQFASGDLDIRTRGDKNTLASVGTTFVSIAEATEPPELMGNDDEKKIYYFDGIWKELDDKFQYKIGSNGMWTSGEEFEDDNSRYESVMVYIRKKASKDILPSIEKTIFFTKDLTFENVKYNVAKGVLEGVNSKIEYNTSSSNKNNGIWENITGTRTDIEPFEGMYLWIREVNKPSSEMLLIENLDRWDKPNLDRVYYNLETNKIANQTSQNLEYKIAHGQWARLDGKSDAYGIKFEPGKLQFRMRATEDKMASHPEQKTIIQAKLSGLNIEFSDIDNEITLINKKESSKWNLFQYRIDPRDTSPWISGELLAAEDLSGDKVVEIRTKTDRNTLSSQITTIRFRENLELKKVTFSQHIDPHELNGTTSEMEYQIYLEDDKRTGWKPCHNGNTILPIWLKTNIDAGTVINIKIRDGREGLHEDITTIY